MRIRPFRRVAAGLCLLLVLLALPPSLTGADDLDYDLPDGSGHFYRQANGQGGAGEMGFSITNANDIRFWDEYQRLGGPEVLGYPASRRFIWDGFTVQVMQKAVLQWRPEVGQAYFVNVFDRMHDLGKDPWLWAQRSIPAHDSTGDAGLSWEQIKARHWALLDQNAAIKAVYWADGDPLSHFGLPISTADWGNVFVVRAQRAVFQQWKEDVPWAKKGEVVIANGGDLAKEAGLFPATAVMPELPPGSTQPVAPPCTGVPIRGFGAAWSEHPEVYELLGCPFWPTQEQAADVAVQRFEHGWMLWLNPSQPGPQRGPGLGPQIYVLFEDNQTFASFPDTPSAGAEAPSPGLVPPAGRLEPKAGFGRVWREGTGVKVRERLGWATEPERRGQGAWQAFQRGRMIWTPDPRLIVILAERTQNYDVLNAWRVFPDTYSG